MTSKTRQEKTAGETLLTNKYTRPGPLPKALRPRRHGRPVEPAEMFPDWDEVGADAKEAAFAAQYILHDFDEAEAYMAVDTRVVKATALKYGRQYLNRPSVQALLKGYMSAWLQGRTFKIEHEIVETLEALAFFDPGTLVTPTGEPRFDSWDEVPPVLRRCVSQIEARFSGRDGERQSVKLTLADRASAISALARYLSMARNGAQSDPSSSAAVGPDGELLLASIFENGRKVDRRTPAQRRGEVETPAPAAPEAPLAPYEPGPVIKGLG